MIRPMIKYLKNNNNVSLTGAEVGVWEGANAKSILDNLNIKMLYLVDHWKKHRIYNGKLFSQDRMDIVLMKTIARLMPYEEKWHIIRQNSINGANHCSDDLDFVYIDSQHLHRATKQDIDCWYPKVRVAGILGGHDYNIGVTDGVCSAVDEFVKREDLELFQEDIDWWIVKK